MTNNNDPTATLVAQLVQLGRARRDWIKTRVGIELRAIAICRRFVGGDKDEARKLWKGVQAGEAPEDLVFAVGPLLQPIATMSEQERKVDRQMTKLASGHPLADWAKGVRGFGHAGLAKVLSECGDVRGYSNPAKLWKRMGLAVIDGGRQRRMSGAEALDHGYNAERRSAMWNVGGAVIGGMGRGPRPGVGEDVSGRDDLTRYQKVFVERLRYEAARDPETFARPHKADPKTGAMRESFSAHAANRAKRYVEKRLLRDLWRASRAA